MGRNKILKDKLLSIKIPTDVHNDLKKIADEIGGLSISSMLRMLIYSRINKVKKSGNPKDFLDDGKK